MKKVHQMMRDYRESKGVSQSHIATDPKIQQDIADGFSFDVEECD